MKRTILLYGRTRSGKTSLIGELAEQIYRESQKKTRLYTIDLGGIGPIEPLISEGIIELISQEDDNPWHFLNKLSKGMVRNEKHLWVPGDFTNIGLIANESMTAFGDAFMNSLADESAGGGNVGGGSNVSFTVLDKGESLKIGGSNMAHYNVTQTRITKEVWASQRLPVDNILWTASVSKDDDQINTGKVLGPAVVGKALTAEVPRWFQYTFRVDCLPAAMGKPERHILYLGNSADVQAGNAVSLGNTRTPIDAPTLPASIEPASLVKALELIDDANLKARETIRKRLQQPQVTKKGV